MTEQKHPATNENDIRTAREHNKPGKETKIYGSINEPPYAPEPFRAEEPAPTRPPHGDPPLHGHASHPADPDKLEERLEEARDEGDYSTRGRHPPPKGRK